MSIITFTTCKALLDEDPRYEQQVAGFDRAGSHGDRTAQAFVKVYQELMNI